eukprot:3480871-Prorocentrum_lima.AAC.1
MAPDLGAREVHNEVSDIPLRCQAGKVAVVGTSFRGEDRPPEWGDGTPHTALECAYLAGG